MPTKWIITNGGGLYVRAQMDTTNSRNIVRRIPRNEGVTVYEVYTVKGSSGLQKWGRISDNPGGRNQEYICLSIGNNMIFAEQEEGTAPTRPTGEPEGGLYRIEHVSADIVRLTRV